MPANEILVVGSINMDLVFRLPRLPQKGETVLFLHYPPLFAGQTLEPFLRLMHKYNVKRCYYGHIHGPAHKYAIEGRVQGIDFFMISSDYIEFDPALIL